MSLERVPYNGRVDIKSPNTSKLFSMYDKIPANQISSFRDPLEGLWDQNPLSYTYFSKENIQIIRNAIRAGVYNKSNGKFVIDSLTSPSDCDTINIVMRSVYLQNSANQPNNITQQVELLNKLVVDYFIQQVYGEAQGYMKYLDDASTLVVPIAHPVLSNTRDKQLELKPWF